MRVFASALFALVLAAGSATVGCQKPHARVGKVAGDYVTLGEELRRVGEVRVHKSEEVASAKMVVFDPDQGQKLVLVEWIEREVRRDEVLAIENGEATRLRVTYLEKSKQSSTNGQPKLLVYPVVGKVFIVDRLVGRTVIAHEDGTPLGLGEEELVAADYKPGRDVPESIDAELKKPLHIGDEIPALGALLRRGMPADIEEAKVHVWLTGVRDNPLGPVAVFSVAIDAIGPDEDIQVGMSLKGELLVRISDGMSLGSDLGGDVAMVRKPSEEAPGVRGAGRIRFVEKTELP